MDIFPAFPLFYLLWDCHTIIFWGYAIPTIQPPFLKCLTIVWLSQSSQMVYSLTPIVKCQFFMGSISPKKIQWWLVKPPCLANPHSIAWWCLAEKNQSRLYGTSPCEKNTGQIIMPIISKWAIYTIAIYINEPEDRSPLITIESQ